MPVTIRTSNNQPRAWAKPPANTPADLLTQSCAKDAPFKQIIQSSFGREDQDIDGHISPHKNGLVHAAVEAYSHHHHLTLRPEDVWFAVLTQLSFYINAHAEELRSVFVAHDGQKEVVVTDVGTIRTVDFGRLAVALTGEMDRHIIDEGLRGWILPDFTTTGPGDVVVAAVLMMGTMQKYFSYGIQLICGIPSVTLLGEREDWVKIRHRLADGRLVDGRWGNEPVQFAARLGTVLDYFIRSFDDPTDVQIFDFWSKIAHHIGGGSGPTYLSGWITAFCFWDADGKPIPGPAPRVGRTCTIDETSFSAVDTTDIPVGYVSVPVKVDDNGTEYKTKMVAGSIGVKVSSSGETLDQSSSAGIRMIHIDGKSSSDKNSGATTGLDTLQPVSGWWMYEPQEDNI
ncbi:hypothetical protein ACRE_037990 [Hapsidospora chrysogenum ATCC 11550]|uniref:DUF4419 domain-containing protein n=1 Tax=Hapsidospora chrysogenum (strain ATCC 11550 / CBS 779.69 / DSM 880 / IAM 14645 / JCM 23072 / IMI 49137) TaxID=857340 RepID=A0A086T7P2_HAPC1|nr:hypothetical protein ACRE_037990 [Hapsidospora chrysogenum ATCC 11550]